MIYTNKLNFFFYTILILLSLIVFFYDSIYFHKYLTLIISFHILIDFIFKAINKNAFNKKNHSVFLVLLSTILRLVLSIIFVFIFGLLSVENFQTFILNFVFAYLLFIIFEITILLINLQRI